MTISASAPHRIDPLRLVLQAGVYVFLYFATAWLCGPLLTWLAGYLGGMTAAGLISALFANWLSLRIYRALPLPAIGLRWNSASAHNLAWGLVGGVGCACLVLAPALVAGAARIVPDAKSEATVGTFLFVSAMLAAGAAGEELLFRGYAFQILLARLGPFATILPVGVVFALVHTANPNATWFGIANTAGFGIAFGYAFLRSRDLWLPMGLHFGWNVTLPLFGVNVSGLRIKVTGYGMHWSAGALWSGGEYGPEASVLTSVALLALMGYLWKAPIRPQRAVLLDPPAEDLTCTPVPPSPPLPPF